VPVPRSDVPGEESVAHAANPAQAGALVRHAITEADLTNITPESHAYALQEFRKYVSGSIYTPPTPAGHAHRAGAISAGAQWHGGSFDPMLNVLYVNVNDAPTINRLRPGTRTDGRSWGRRAESQQLGRQIYEIERVSCHGADRQGVPPHTPDARRLNVEPTGDRCGRHSKGATHAGVTVSSAPMN
jgi:quinoprotein glucose dehydrogenase